MNNKNLESYVSLDIETNGPIPFIYSMLSFGAAAFDKERGLINTFTANLETLPDAKENPDTMEWWQTQPEAYAATRKNIVSPENAMKNFVIWLKGLPGRPVAVCYPAGFDFTFIYSYLIAFAGESPFSFSCIDIKTYAFAKLKCPYRMAVKGNFPKGWLPRKRKHTHIALDDAIEQGELFMNMLKSQI